MLLAPTSAPIRFRCLRRGMRGAGTSPSILAPHDLIPRRSHGTSVLCFCVSGGGCGIRTAGVFVSCRLVRSSFIIRVLAFLAGIICVLCLSAAGLSLPLSCCVKLAFLYPLSRSSSIAARSFSSSARGIIARAHACFSSLHFASRVLVVHRCACRLPSSPVS